MERTTEATHTDRERTYVLLTIEHRKLLLPQNEVRTLESVLDIRAQYPPVNGVGWLPFEHHHWPVYGMDAALNPLSTVPSNQRICAVLTLEGGYFGLLGTDVATVQGSAVELQPLPRAMAMPNTPLRSLALLGDHIGLVSAAAALAVYFQVNLEALVTV